MHVFNAKDAILVLRYILFQTNISVDHPIEKNNRLHKLVVSYKCELLTAVG